MLNPEDRIVVLDVETTGLDFELDPIIQIAAIVVDRDLNPVSDLFCRDVYSVHALRRLATNDFVREMHTKTGLYARLLASAEASVLRSIYACDARPALQKHIEAHRPPGGTLYLAGNSVHFDLRALHASAIWRPVADLFHHRLFDVSAAAQIEALAGVPAAETDPAPEHVPHDAGHDVLASLEQLRAIVARRRAERDELCAIVGGPECTS